MIKDRRRTRRRPRFNLMIFSYARHIFNCLMFRDGSRKRDALLEPTTAAPTAVQENHIYFVQNNMVNEAKYELDLSKITSSVLPSVDFAKLKSGLVISALSILGYQLLTSIFIYPAFRLLFGTLYPAYASYKAVKTKNVKEYVSTSTSSSCIRSA